MCILIVKPAGKVAPSRDILERCFESNPDGAGICYEKNGSIVIRKGLMDFKSFYKEVQSIPVESTALIHCRIGTSGGNIPELTHPYPLTNNIKELKKTKLLLSPKKNKDGTLEKVYAVGHNGVFSGLGETGAVNDTCMFIANILTPLLELSGDILNNKLDAIINRLVDSSRVAIMDNTGRVRMYGDGWEEQDGIYYSNSGYKKPTYTYNYKDYGWEGYYDRGAWKTSYKDYYADLLIQFGTWQNYLNYSKLSEPNKLEYLCEKYPSDEDWIRDLFNEGYYDVEDIRSFLFDEYHSYTNDNYSLLTDDDKK